MTTKLGIKTNSGKDAEILSDQDDVLQHRKKLDKRNSQSSLQSNHVLSLTKGMI